MTSWAATVRRTDRGLRLRFEQPVRDVYLTAETARQLAAALLVCASLDDEHLADLGYEDGTIETRDGAS